jgi:hypothetical protein
VAGAQTAGRNQKESRHYLESISCPLLFPAYRDLESFVRPNLEGRETLCWRLSSLWWLKTTMSARKAPCARNPRTPAHKRGTGIALKINSFGNSWDQGMFGIAFALFYSGSS